MWRVHSTIGILSEKVGGMFVPQCSGDSRPSHRHGGSPSRNSRMRRFKLSRQSGPIPVAMAPGFEASGL